MSNEQPPERKVIPYKSGKRPSTFRRLNIDFAGTALEEALNEQQRQRDPKLSNIEQIHDGSLRVPAIHQSPPVTTTPQFGLLNEQVPIITDDFVEKKGKLEPSTEKGATSEGQLPPVTTTPLQDDLVIETRIAPSRDFNRRANSLDRDAMPSGLFPGSTKKVYDALYIRTRGAIVPTKTVQASRRDLLIWTGIRNLKTIDNHIRYLMATGLIVRHWELGSNEGSSYEVRLPEDLTAHQYPPLPTSGGESPLTTTPQKTDSGYTQKLGSGGECQAIDNIATSPNYKTYKTNTDDDTHTLDEFLGEFMEAVRDVCGGKLINTEQERERWRGLGRLLAEELKEAAQHTETINSVPAFFTTHLRRRLARNSALPVETKKTREVKTKNYRTLATEVNPGESKGSVDDPHRGTASTGKSKFSLEECHRYAAHLHTTGQGIKNPGGFAMAIHRSGMADPLIAKFLNPTRDQPVQDFSKCPDCKGANFYYPKGMDKGVVKCKHERMEVGGPSSNLRLTPEEITEQAGIIAELLRSGYTVEQAEKQLAGGLEREVWEEIISQAEQARTGT